MTHSVRLSGARSLRREDCEGAKLPRSVRTGRRTANRPRTALFRDLPVVGGVSAVTCTLQQRAPQPSVIPEPGPVLPDGCDYCILSPSGGLANRSPGLFECCGMPGPLYADPDSVRRSNPASPWLVHPLPASSGVRPPPLMRAIELWNPCSRALFRRGRLSCAPRKRAVNSVHARQLRFLIPTPLHCSTSAGERGATARHSMPFVPPGASRFEDQPGRSFSPLAADAPHLHPPLCRRTRLHRASRLRPARLDRCRRELCRRPFRCHRLGSDLPVRGPVQTAAPNKY